MTTDQLIHTHVQGKDLNLKKKYTGEYTGHMAMILAAYLKMTKLLAEIRVCSLNVFRVV